MEGKIALIRSGKEKKKKKGLDKSSSGGKKKKRKSGSGRSKKSKTSSKSSKKSKASKTSKQSKSSTRSKRSKSSKTSSRSSRKRKKVDNRETFMGIPAELFFEIVQLKLREFHALVIESLDSIFIRRPLLVLNSLLRGIGNIRYIHCFIISYTYQQSKVYEDKKKQLALKNEEEELKRRLEEIIRMSYEEFAQLSESDRAFFKKAVLVPRKANTARKQAALRYFFRRLEALDWKQQTSN